MLVKLVIFVSLMSSALAQTNLTKQEKWIENKVEVIFDSGYLIEGNDLILSWVIKNHTGKDIKLIFDQQTTLLESFSFNKEPTRVFLKRKDNNSAIRIDPNNINPNSIWFLDNLIPEDLNITFRIKFKIPNELKTTSFFQKKPTYQDIKIKHLGNIESIIIYVPNQKLKITFPIP
jgi:hypothetical protein